MPVSSCFFRPGSADFVLSVPALSKPTCPADLWDRGLKSVAPSTSVAGIDGYATRTSGLSSPSFLRRLMVWEGELKSPLYPILRNYYPVSPFSDTMKPINFFCPFGFGVSINFRISRINSINISS